MKKTILSALISLSLLSTVCDAKEYAVVDGSSYQTLEASITNIQDNLPSQKAKSFDKATLILMLHAGSLVKEELKGKSKEESKEIMMSQFGKMVDGKTADQVIALREDLQSQK